MSTIYLIGFIVIIKALYSLCKKSDINQSTTIQEQTEPEKPKNKWLYPTDEFGKMEKGTVYESKTYESGVRDGENITKFSIKLKHRTTNKGNF